MNPMTPAVLPVAQRSSKRSGLGLGLTIARQSMEADSGTLGVRNVPGIGCVFSIRMPRHVGQQACSPGDGADGPPAH
jgi:K+-sensing histidine kinase KdpD